MGSDLDDPPEAALEHALDDQPYHIERGREDGNPCFLSERSSPFVVAVAGCRSPVSSHGASLCNSPPRAPLQPGLGVPQCEPPWS